MSSRRNQPSPASRSHGSESPDGTTRIVILGSGFGGFAAARELESRLKPGEAEIVMVSEANYHLFTPMLAEVAGGTVEPWHVAVSVRRALARTDFAHGRVVAVDPQRRRVGYRSDPDEPTVWIGYDRLIVALGSEPATHGVAGVREHALPFRQLPDAGRLRNHAIAVLEEADAAPESGERRALLTFVVVGGGYSGVEAITHMRGLVLDLLPEYEQVEREDVRFVLVHSHERLLPQIGDALAAYVADKLQREGIELILGQHAVEVGPAFVALESGERIATQTPVWTSGLRPSGVLERFPFHCTEQGALEVDACLVVPDAGGEVWAVGDCAAVPDLAGEGELCPKTAQHARHQGAHAAGNVVASLRGEEPSPFRYRSPGMLVPLGGRDAVAEIWGFRFSGPIAWFVWRTVYWTLLPGIAKKFRVAADWTADLIFGREVVLTRDPLTLGSRRHRGGPAGVEWGAFQNEAEPLDDA